jgi:hypothetical protein
VQIALPASSSTTDDQPLRLLLVRSRPGELPWLARVIAKAMAPLEIIEVIGFANALWRLGNERFDSVLLDLEIRDPAAMAYCREQIADVAGAGSGSARPSRSRRGGARTCGAGQGAQPGARQPPGSGRPQSVARPLAASPAPAGATGAGGGGCAGQLSAGAAGGGSVSRPSRAGRGLRWPGRRRGWRAPLEGCRPRFRKGSPEPGWQTT